LRAGLAKETIMIPPLNESGCLPEGIHDGTMDEAAGRFGVFQTSDRRLQLWAKFTEFIQELKACDFMEAVLVDGSFVTDRFTARRL
jgi:hypothetical protein